MINLFDKEQYDDKDGYASYYVGDNPPKSIKEMCWSKLILSQLGWLTYVTSLPETPSDKFKSNLDTFAAGTAAYTAGLVGIVAKNVVKGMMGGFDKKEESEESLNTRIKLSSFIPAIDIIEVEKVKVSTGMFSSMKLLKIISENKEGLRLTYWFGKIDFSWGDEMEITNLAAFKNTGEFEGAYLKMIEQVEEHAKELSE